MAPSRPCILSVHHKASSRTSKDSFGHGQTLGVSESVLSPNSLLSTFNAGFNTTGSGGMCCKSMFSAQYLVSNIISRSILGRWKTCPNLTSIFFPCSTAVPWFYGRGQRGQSLSSLPGGCYVEPCRRNGEAVTVLKEGGMRGPSRREQHEVSTRPYKNLFFFVFSIRLHRYRVECLIFLPFFWTHPPSSNTSRLINGFALHCLSEGL